MNWVKVMATLDSYDKISSVKLYNEENLLELQKIANPIQQHFKIKLLTFRRLFPDGRIIHISNDKKWLSCSFEKGFWQSSTSMNRINSIPVDNQYSHIWNNHLQATDHVYQAMYDHNLWHGTTLYDKRDSYVDLWAFATDRNNSNAIDFYANHMDIIKQFILYMHEQARHILFPKDREITIKTDNHFECEHTENTDKNQILFEFSKYYYGKEQGQYLTRSQFLCVYLLSCGNSMKEIANKLTISSRTVECHLNAVKQKLGETCRSKLLERAKYLINMHK